MQSFRKFCWLYSQHLYIYKIYRERIWLLFHVHGCLALPGHHHFLPGWLQNFSVGFCFPILVPLQSVLNTATRTFLKYRPLYSFAQKAAMVPLLTQSKNKSPPGLKCSAFCPTSLTPLASSPTIAPCAHLFQPDQSPTWSQKHIRNVPTFVPLFWLILLP